MSTELRKQPALAPAIESLLERLRKRIRAYVWLEGIAVAVVLLGASFWASLTFDWVFEPPVGLRVALLGAVAIVLFYVVFRYILRRAFVRLSNRSMAVLLERRFERFHDSLLTTVELAEQPPPVDDGSGDYRPEMFAHVQQEALAGTAAIPLKKVFNSARLARRIFLGALLLVSVAAFGIWDAEAFGIWAQRSLLMSDRLWPRKTHLVVERFDEQPAVKVARGGDLELVVKAEAAPGRDVPETVEVRMMTVDRRREKMSREGAAVPGKDEFQSYSYKFKSVLESVDFYVVGGDDRRGPFKLEVVDSPTISEMVLHCEYPEYMRRSPRDIPMAANMRVPVGTEITIHAQANKDLVRVQVDDLVDDTTPLTTKIDMTGSSGAGGRKFAFKLPTLAVDKTLSFTLVDTDGIRSRDPVRLAIGAVPDEAPQVNVQLKGIGTAITANARLPVVGEITDDYGVAKAWWDFHVDDGAAQQQPFEAEISGQDKVPVSEALEVRELKLEPKQKLHLAVQAADNYALAAEPHLGSSPRYALDVVTPEKLRSLMESRELVLRRRFEVIIQELTETRDLLARIDFGKGPGAADAAAENAGKSPAVGKEDDKDKADPDSRSSPEDRSPERLLALRRVQTERVLQNSERSAHETLGLAVAIDDIREELINNRVDTEELKTRLKEGISDPLKRIVENRFPELETRVKKLAATLTDPQTGLAARSSAREEADTILVEMREVLDKMVELETFNEALDLLRDIISAQQKVHDATEKKHKKNTFSD